MQMEDEWNRKTAEEVDDIFGAREDHMNHEVCDDDVDMPSELAINDSDAENADVSEVTRMHLSAMLVSYPMLTILLSLSYTTRLRWSFSWLELPTKKCMMLLKRRSKESLALCLMQKSSCSLKHWRLRSTCR